MAHDLSAPGQACNQPQVGFDCRGNSVAIWEQLEEPVKALGVTLRTIKLEETENNYVEYHGER